MELNDNNNQEPTRNNFNFEEQFEDLCRIYEIGCNLIDKVNNKQELMDAILDEYIFRFDEMPGTDINKIARDNGDSEIRNKLKSLVMFATQAVALREKAILYKELELKNQQLIRTNEQLLERNEQLIHLNEHYLNMLSFVSHELRSPLISILGYAELMNDRLLGEINKDQNDALQVIRRVVKNLINMTKNYLDLSKMEVGKLKLRREVCNLKTGIIEPVLVEMKEQFTQKEMKIVCQMKVKQENYPLNVDREMMKVVFTNIFSNAIRYGKRGSEILYSINGDDKFHKIEIFNYGPGVSHDKLDRLFDKFSRFSESFDAETERGTGLGLYISKNIIEMHHGEVWAESQKGEWFKVFIQIPKN